MKTIKLSSIMASTLIAGSFLLIVPAISNASSLGQGWDTFNSGDGERITVSESAYMGASLSSAPGQGWDTFNSGDGVSIPASNPAYRGTSRKSVQSGGAYGKGIYGE